MIVCFHHPRWKIWGENCIPWRTKLSCKMGILSYYTLQLWKLHRQCDNKEAKVNLQVIFVSVLAGFIAPVVNPWFAWSMTDRMYGIMPLPSFKWSHTSISRTRIHQVGHLFFARRNTHTLLLSPFTYRMSYQCPTFSTLMYLYEWTGKTNKQKNPKLSYTHATWQSLHSAQVWSFVLTSYNSQSGNISLMEVTMFVKAACYIWTGHIFALSIGDWDWQQLQIPKKLKIVSVQYQFLVSELTHPYEQNLQILRCTDT